MAGQDAFGAKLAQSNMGSSPTFTEIANVSNIGGPSVSIEALDVTAHDSADEFKEFIGGLGDGGEVSLSLNWDSTEATHNTLVTTALARSNVDYKLTFADGGEWAFEALITGLEFDNPVDGKEEASVTFKVSGKPVFTDESSSS